MAQGFVGVDGLVHGFGVEGGDRVRGLGLELGDVFLLDDHVDEHEDALGWQVDEDVARRVVRAVAMRSSAFSTSTCPTRGWLRARASASRCSCHRTPKPRNVWSNWSAWLHKYRRRHSCAHSD